MKIILFLAGTLVLGHLSGCEMENQINEIALKKVENASQATMEVCFGLYSSDKLRTLITNYKPIKTYLEKQAEKDGLAIDIKTQVYSTYDKAIDAIARGECDFFRFGPASYILAQNKNPNIELLAMEHKKQKKRFNGVFIVSKDSPFKSIEDLRGKSFAFGSEFSTIGRFLSQAEFIKAGIYAKDLGYYKYLGNHDKVAKFVATGEYDAGVVKESTYKKNKDKLNVIAKFPNVTKPWVAREGLDSAIFSSLKKSLLGLNDSAVLKALKKDGFLEASDGDYDFVRNGMKLSQNFNQSDST